MPRTEHRLQLAPTHRVLLGEPPWAESILFHPDGTQALVIAQDAVVDVWDLLIRVWPEWLGAAVALAIGLALVRIVHCLRTPQRVGNQYCRLCGYDRTMHGDAAGVPECSECGSRTSAAPGRRFRQRVAWRAGLATALLTCYAALLSLGVPRFPAWMDWFDWHSRWAHLALMRAYRSSEWRWLQREPIDVHCLYALDLRTGTTRMRWRIDTRPDLSPMLAPTGDALYLCDSRSKESVSVDVRSGRKRTLPLPLGSHLLGFDNVSGALLAWSGEFDTWSRQHWQYDPHARVARKLPLAETMRPVPIGGAAWPQLLHAPRGSACRFVSVWERGAIGFYREATIRAYDADLRLVREFSVDLPPARFACPALSPDGSALFMALPDGIDRIDTATGIRSRYLPVDGDRDLALLDISADGRVLLCWTSDHIQLFDIESAAPLAELTIPRGLRVGPARISTDGRWVAAIANRPPTAEERARSAFPRLTSEVLVWDLSGALPGR